MSTSRRTSKSPVATSVGLALSLTLAWGQQIAFAQSVLDFDDWMQKIDRRSQSVQRNLARQDASAATADARAIDELYSSMEIYFTRKGDSANAVKISQEGRDLVSIIVSSVTAHDFSAAARAAQTLAKACRTCHLQYKPLD